MVDKEKKATPSVPDTRLEFGRKVLVQADTPMGSVRISGRVTDVGSHSFRIKCSSPIPKDDLHPGQTLTISLVDKKGVLPVTTGFVRILDEDLHVMVMRLPSDDWRQNRRAFFRGEIALPAVILRSDRTRLQGMTSNISGGGALVVLNAPLKMGEEFHLTIQITKKETIGARAQVVWSMFDEEQGVGHYGINFMDIKPRDENRICRLVLVNEFEKRRSEIRDISDRGKKR